MAEQRANLRHRMAEHHEEHLADILGARKTRGSGNQWANQMDVRQSRYTSTVAFAVDGKSTMARSISVSRDMLDKAVEQAAAERPMVALRYYDDERLRGFEDWMIVREEDLLELLHCVDALDSIRVELGALKEDDASATLASLVLGDMPEAVQESLAGSGAVRDIIRLAATLTATRVVDMLDMAVRTA